MHVRSSVGILTTVALAGIISLPAGSGASPAGPRGAAGHLVPALAGHQLGVSLAFPPDTQYCRTNVHLSCYQPAQMQAAYNLQPLFDRGIDGRGRTIVIVDPFGSPTIREDLEHFDETFGIPDPPSLTILEPAGRVPAYPEDPFGRADRSGWAVETSLDVEWSHVFAPGAAIVLVETPTSETEGIQGLPEIVRAENYVIDHGIGDVISQSFAATEETFPSNQAILALRSAFFNARRHHVTVLAASGDSGVTGLLPDQKCCYSSRVNAWPSSDPLVTSIGGTQLHLDENGSRTSPDEVWNDTAVLGPSLAGAAGGGVSHVFGRPAFQDGKADVVGNARGTPDISMSAAIDGAVDVYYSFCDWGRPDPASGKTPLCGPQWHIAGGTSEASPEFAGVVALADQAAGHRLGWLNPKLYHLADARRSGIVDVTSGNNTYVFCSAACGTPSETTSTVVGFEAVTGYDLSSGLGTIDADRLAHAFMHLETESSCAPVLKATNSLFNPAGSAPSC
jgi:subtilase family serine protease